MGCGQSQDAVVHPDVVPYDRLSVTCTGRVLCGEEPKYLLDEGTWAPNQYKTSKWDVLGLPCSLDIRVSGAAVSLSSYALKSANDFPGRDPSCWTLSGIGPGGKPHKLHEVNHPGVWSGRWQWRSWSLSHTTPFNHFRIDITANNGQPNTQLGQLRFIAAEFAAVLPARRDAPASRPERTLSVAAASQPKPVPAEVQRKVPYSLLSVSTTGQIVCGEEAKYLLDEGTAASTVFGSSKWNVNGLPCSIDIRVGGPAVALTSYALKSANDMPGRDPSRWTLSGICSDGKAHKLHEVDKKGVWSQRWQWRSWSFRNTASFNRFRIDVAANNGDPCTQLGQLSLSAEAAAEVRVLTLLESSSLSAAHVYKIATLPSGSTPSWQINPSGQPFHGEWAQCTEATTRAVETAFQVAHSAGVSDGVVELADAVGTLDMGLLTLRVASRPARPLRRVIGGVVTAPPPHAAHPWYLSEIERVDKRGGVNDWLTTFFFWEAFQTAVLRDGGELGFKAEDLFSFHFSQDFRGTQAGLERRGDVLYEVPVGWKRFALRVKDKYPDGNDWMCMDGRPGEWAVAYHGTKFGAVPKIIQHGFRVGIRHGPAACKMKDTRSGQPVKEGICCTPNLKVVECFANGEEADTGRPPVTLDGHTLFFALQCRVRPGAIRRPNNTIYTKTNNDEEQMGVRGVFEWVIEDPNDIRPYAVLVRERDGGNKLDLHQLARSFEKMQPKPGSHDHIPGRIDAEAQRRAEAVQVAKMDRGVRAKLTGHEARGD